ncbi:DNA-binding response OmpR family regulator [Granulicella aggregans]|uniref:DNA-binding response OmpR family regulator n=1 Tax=Granulicella aggregans TaxID=474949 RepID=A0A7W8E5U8_9BACT|nr:response regulator transcription factor [Granulicella aggregans]MBB5059689.1 DNA-binding response OmpR family regulator [Granulicella aggregans]
MNLILVIEDDPRIQRALERQFAAEGYKVHIEGDGPAGLAAAKSMKPDAVVLDLMLPGLSGRIICKDIKQWSCDTPVIVLSAISEVADKVLLLETGADDYVTKPFSPRELLARVQAAIRRNARKAPAEAVSASPSRNAFKISKVGEVEVDFITMEAHRGGIPVPLTAHEFKLLRFFLENPGRAIAREELLSGVWGLNFNLTTRTVDNQMLKLRQKLETDPANPIHFRTVHGVGYKFVPASTVQ